MLLTSLLFNPALMTDPLIAQAHKGAQQMFAASLSSPFVAGSVALNNPTFRVELFHTYYGLAHKPQGMLQMDISWRRTTKVGGWHSEYVAQYATNNHVVAICEHMAKEIVERVTPEKNVSLGATTLRELIAWLIQPVAMLIWPVPTDHRVLCMAEEAVKESVGG